MKILLVEDEPDEVEPFQTALLQALHGIDGTPEAEVAQWLISQTGDD